MNALLSASGLAWAASRTDRIYGSGSWRDRYLFSRIIGELTSVIPPAPVVVNDGMVPVWTLALHWRGVVLGWATLMIGANPIIVPATMDTTGAYRLKALALPSFGWSCLSVSLCVIIIQKL